MCIILSYYSYSIPLSNMGFASCSFCFISFWALISAVSEEGLHMRQNYLCRNFSKECRVAMCGGIIFAGFYGVLSQAFSDKILF